MKFFVMTAVFICVLCSCTTINSYRKASINQITSYSSECWVDLKPQKVCDTLKTEEPLMCLAKSLACNDEAAKPVLELCINDLTITHGAVREDSLARSELVLCMESRDWSRSSMIK